MEATGKGVPIKDFFSRVKSLRGYSIKGVYTGWGTYKVVRNLDFVMRQEGVGAAVTSGSFSVDTVGGAKLLVMEGRLVRRDRSWVVLKGVLAK